MRYFAFALMVSLCASTFGQSAKSAVEVAVALQQGTEDRNPDLPDDYGSRQVNARWSVEKPEQQPVPKTVHQPGVTLYTADDSWVCPPCKQQAVYLAGVPSDLYTVVKVSQSRASALGGVPYWQPADNTTGRRGAWKAEQLIPWLKSKAKVATPATAVAITRSEIDSWIRSNYKPDTFLDISVEPKSNVWNHLTDGTDQNHKFSKDQVQGLEQWVALALHNEIHKTNPGISPFRQQVALSSKPDEISMTVEIDSDDPRYVISAIAEALQQESDEPPAVQGILPALPIDLDDDLLKLLDSLLSPDGYRKDGLQLTWGTGLKKVSFEPGMYLKFRKVAEVDATIHSLEVNGRTVTVFLSGTIISKLTVKLK